MRNQRGFSAILVILGFILVISVATGVYFIKNSKPKSTQPTSNSQNNLPSAQTIKQISSTSAQQKETVNWKIYSISDCLVTFKYPSEWGKYLSNKDKCTVRYTKPAASEQPIDTFIVFDVQPEAFMGQQNVEIDENKVINKATLNGIEQTTTYSEEKDKNRPIYLSNKNFFFKKGPVYFRIVSQYEKGDKDFENTLDKLAESVVMSGDEAFYSNYVKKLESELGNFTPKNK